jgi:hypothetical protein
MKILWDHKEEKFGLPDSIPDDILDERHAKYHHNQKLERLNQRGGMGVDEIVCNIMDISLSCRAVFDDKKCADYLKKHLKYKGYEIKT